MWFIFLASFGFAGGGYFLLFLVVPFEEMLVNKDWTQKEIDQLMSYFVYGWVVFGFIISIIYYKFLYNHASRRLVSYVILVFVVINAGYVFYLFTNTESALISMAQGEVDQVNEQFTFGPYPDEKVMEQLKNEKYDGIITLLSTSLVFEKQLLDNEVKNGEESGLTVHSFPMLPWVGDNRSSLEGIKELIRKDPSKRYYVHCYLGKHRVDMVRQIIMNEAGITSEDSLSILPSDFERGNVYTFSNESIIIGPYPTDEEWFMLFRRNVQEVISTIDPTSELFETEKRIAEEQGIKLTSIPLESKNPDPKVIQNIVEYVNGLKHPVYIHGFHDSNSLFSLDFTFRFGKPSIDLQQIPKGFRDEFVVGTWMTLDSSMPTKQDMEFLAHGGIEIVVEIGDESNSPLKKDVEEAGMKFEEYHLTEPSNSKLFEIAKELVNKKSTIFVSGSNKVILEKLQRVLSGMTNGLKKSHFENVELSNGELYVIDRDMIIGPELNKDQWSTFLVENGITRVILLYVASMQTEQVTSSQQLFATSFNQRFEMVPMHEQYLGDIIAPFMNNDETTYIIVPEKVQSMVIENIRGAR